MASPAPCLTGQDVGVIAHVIAIVVVVEIFIIFVVEISEIVVISAGPKLFLGLFDLATAAIATDTVDAATETFVVVSGIAKIGDVVLAPLAGSGSPFEIFGLSGFGAAIGSAFIDTLLAEVGHLGTEGICLSLDTGYRYRVGVVVAHRAFRNGMRGSWEG